MTVLAAGRAPSRDAAATRPARAYVASVERDWRGLEHWTGAGTGFQSATWLATWYETIAAGNGLEPLLVTIRDAASAEIALRLPLVLREEKGLRVVEFADLGLTDFNAPLVGPAAPMDRRGAIAAIKALRRALPPADLLRLAKMPRALPEGPNPLCLHPAIVESALGGNLIRMGEDYAAWLRGLGRTYRKEIERSWRVFLRQPETRFEIVTDPALAQRIMAGLERQQGDRMRTLGKDYLLDDPDVSRFYRTIVARGVADGSIVVSALRAGEDLVAAIVGVLGPNGCVLIRISHAGAEWSNCSPGRLVIERTLSHLHGEGWRRFDFSIGDYEYKRRFGTDRAPLCDYVAPLGWCGLKAALRARIVGRIRRYPGVDARLRSLRKATMRG